MQTQLDLTERGPATWNENAEMDNKLDYARAMLPAEITADRCRHPSVTTATIWLFRNGAQIGAISEIGKPPTNCWKANRMFAGQPISEKTFDTLCLAVQHVTEQGFVDNQPPAAAILCGLTRNQRSALRLLGVYTAGSFDIWQTAGNAKASARAHIMSELNGKRTPQAKSGVTAMTAAFFAIANPTGSCEAVREDNFVKWARDMDVYRMGEAAEAAKKRLSL